MTTKNLVIRQFVLEDYVKVINLWIKSGLPYKPKGRDSFESIQKEMEKGVAIFLLALIDEQIVGTILGTHDGRKGWINRLAVDPDYRRQGVARSLLKTIEESFEKMRLEIVTCLIEAWNTDSMSFFEKMGYIKHQDILYFSKRKNPDV